MRGVMVSLINHRTGAPSWDMPYRGYRENTGGTGENTGGTGEKYRGYRGKNPWDYLQ